MSRRFDSFAVIASMRTGSNLLEESLSAHPDLSCHGELFNPHFVGRPKQDAALGVSQQARDAEPARLLAALREQGGGLAGFRIFDDHDPRALDLVLDDPRCAKIVLTRNPLESYVSLKIARSTGQWWLGDLRSARAAKVRFDAEEFAAYLAAQSMFRQDVRRRLQVSGQTAFWLRYDELADREVVTGLYRFLEVAPQDPPRRLRSKVQNPGTVSDKVTNPKAMAAALARHDPFDLERIPDFEPARGIGAPGFRVGSGVPLLFMPIGDVATDAVDRWLTEAAGGVAPDTGLTQKMLRVWMRTTPGHRRFSVVSHPVDRIHAVFCNHILRPDVPAMAQLRKTLIRRFAVPLPDHPDASGYDDAAHHRAFLGFLGFVTGNLSGQTSFKVDPLWASQTALLGNAARLVPPDRVIRQADLHRDLPSLARETGIDSPPIEPYRPSDRLMRVYDHEIERAVKAAYRRDYLFLGFEDWPGGQAA